MSKIALKGWELLLEFHMGSSVTWEKKTGRQPAAETVSKWLSASQIVTDRLDTESSSTRLTGTTPDLYQTSAPHSASSLFCISDFLYFKVYNLLDKIKVQQRHQCSINYGPIHVLILVCILDSWQFKRDEWGMKRDHWNINEWGRAGQLTPQFIIVAAALCLSTAVAPLTDVALVVYSQAYQLGL